MNWEILEKVVRFKGRLAHTDIIIERKDEQSPFIYAIVDEPRDKAIILHAMCDSIEEAKTMALGSLQAYEAITQKWESYLVCPILPYGLIALTLDSTPKVHKEFELFLKTIGGITFLHFYRSKSRGENGNNGHRDRSVKKSGALTGRQEAIKDLIEKGLSNPEIAKEIGYSESLVRQETMAIYSTLNVSGRKELIERKTD
jgi:DNA-binding CsgD family transcriptional regulator